MSTKNGRQEKYLDTDYSRKKWLGLGDAETRNLPIVRNEDGESHINF